MAEEQATKPKAKPAVKGSPIMLRYEKFNALWVASWGDTDEYVHEDANEALKGVLRKITERMSAR
jgi:hypothetical protein